MSTPIKTASVLAFERKLDPSDALLFSGTWKSRDSMDTWRPIKLREKSVRGTISNRLKAKDQDPAKLDAEIEKPNLQRVDVATLPPEADTLKVQFTLRVLSGVGTPSACNNEDYRTKLRETVKGYVDSNGFAELSKRYAYNLANGRFLWRNRICAGQIEVRIMHSVNDTAASSWTFDALTLSLRNFEATKELQDPLDKLAQIIAEGLNGSRHVLLEIAAFVRLGECQEVFPSQELILDRGRREKSKTLYHVDGIAAIHSQKIGNAIRTIDTWHPSAGEIGPIAVEPYGSVTAMGKAYRQPKERVDFYSLLDDWLLKGKAPSVDNQHFVNAVLIRGGVFGDKE